MISIERLTQIVQLRDEYGDSTRVELAPAHAAIDDLLAEHERLGKQVNRLSDLQDRPRKSIDSSCPLTPVQLEALIGAALGETARESAARLGANAETVRSRRQAACARLGVHSSARAVALCCAAGWITADDITIPGDPR